MQIRTGRTVCGVDGARLRAFLHQFPTHFVFEDFEETLLLDPHTAKDILLDLAKEGYVVNRRGDPHYFVQGKAQSIVTAHPGGT